MAGARARRNRAQDGGQPQGGGLRKLIAEELQRALRPAPRGAAAQREALRPRPEWRCRCGPCTAPNWEERTHCRKCGEPKGAKGPRSGKPGGLEGKHSLATAPAARGPRKLWADEHDEEGLDDTWADEAPRSRGAAATAGTDTLGSTGLTRKAPTPPSAAGSRAPAPEERTAKANAQAEALELSAASLRTAGLPDRAAEQEAEAARLRKQAAAATPPPGRRLDELEGYLARCQRRARTAAAATQTAETALAEANKAQAEADTEERDATAKLEQLRADLTRSDVAMPDASAKEPGEATEAEAELAKLRAVLRATEEQRDAAHLAAGHPPPEPEEPLSREAETELEEKLQEAQTALAAALGRGTATAQQAGELAVLTARLEAARSKRRRVTAEESAPRTPR